MNARLECCYYSVLSDLPGALAKFSESRASPNSGIIGERRENNIPSGRKQHYVVDYFVVVDFAVYDRYS